MRHIFPSDKIGTTAGLTYFAGLLDATSSVDAEAGVAAAPYDETTLSTSESSAVWRMEIRSLKDADTGNNYLQVTHELEANIMETDYIEFSVEFLNAEKTSTDDGDAWTDVSN